jgi:hypothetical protein
MNDSDIVLIEERLGLKLPLVVRAFLTHIDSLPPTAITERFVLRSPAEMLDLNRRLRSNGYYHLPWFAEFLAIGADPGDCIFFIDLRDTDYPVRLADHDFDDVQDFPEIVRSVNSYPEYLLGLISQWQKEGHEPRT